MSASEDSVQTQILKPEIRQKRKKVDENKINKSRHKLIN